MTPNTALLSAPDGFGGPAGYVSDEWDVPPRMSLPTVPPGPPGQGQPASRRGTSAARRRVAVGAAVVASAGLVALLVSGVFTGAPAANQSPAGTATTGAPATGRQPVRRRVPHVRRPPAARPARAAATPGATSPKATPGGKKPSTSPSAHPSTGSTPSGNASGTPSGGSSRSPPARPRPARAARQAPRRAGHRPRRPACSASASRSGADARSTHPFGMTLLFSFAERRRSRGRGGPFSL